MKSEDLLTYPRHEPEAGSASLLTAPGQRNGQQDLRKTSEFYLVLVKLWGINDCRCWTWINDVSLSTILWGEVNFTCLTIECLQYSFYWLIFGLLYIFEQQWSPQRNKAKHACSTVIYIVLYLIFSVECAKFQNIIGLVCHFKKVDMT